MHNGSKYTESLIDMLFGSIQWMTTIRVSNFPQNRQTIGRDCVISSILTVQE